MSLLCCCSRRRRGVVAHRNAILTSPARNGKSVLLRSTTVALPRSHTGPHHPLFHSSAYLASTPHPACSPSSSYADDRAATTYGAAATKLHGDTIDLCGGSTTIDGVYHYHNAPGCIQEQVRSSKPGLLLRSSSPLSTRGMFTV